MNKMLNGTMLASCIALSGLLVASPAHAVQVCITAGNGALVCYDDGSGGVAPGSGTSGGDGQENYVAPPAPAAPPPSGPICTNPVGPCSVTPPADIPMYEVPHIPAVPVHMQPAVPAPAYQAPVPAPAAPAYDASVQPAFEAAATIEQPAVNPVDIAPAVNEAEAVAPVDDEVQRTPSSSPTASGTPRSSAPGPSYSSISPEATEVIEASSVNNTAGINAAPIITFAALLLVALVGGGVLRKLRSKRL